MPSPEAQNVADEIEAAVKKIIDDSGQPPEKFTARQLRMLEHNPFGSGGRGWSVFDIGNPISLTVYSAWLSLAPVQFYCKM